MDTITYLTLDELRRVLTYSKKKDYRFYSCIYLCFSFGLRISELLALKESDVDFPGNRVLIRRLKGSNATNHELSKEQRQVLNRALTHKYRGRLFHFHRSTMDRKIKQLFRKLRIARSKAHFHTLKHTAAIQLLQNGTDVRSIQAFLGHKSIDSTLQYLRITGADIDRATKLLDDLL